MIINYKTKNEELHIKNFYKGGDLQLDESPWSADEKKIVYTILKNIQVNLMGTSSVAKNDSIAREGSYIFDIEKSKDIKFLPQSIYAVWHPDSNIIAYVKNKEIWLYNVDKDFSQCLFVSKNTTEIMDIHWSPEGDYIFMRYHLNKSRKSKQQLIKINDGTVTSDINLPIFVHNYTWR